MRNMLDLDDDVLAAAKDIARREGKTVDRVISKLARQALTQGRQAQVEPEQARKTGFLPFASRGSVVTSELIDRLRDEGEY